MVQVTAFLSAASRNTSWRWNRDGREKHVSKGSLQAYDSAEAVWLLQGSSHLTSRRVLGAGRDEICKDERETHLNIAEL